MGGGVSVTRRRPPYLRGRLVPAVVMPDSTQSVLADLRARVAKLETTPPGAMTVLATVGSGGPVAVGPYNWIGTLTRLPETTTPGFTLLRPMPILLIPSLTFVTNGGTASYGVCQGYISATNGIGAVPANDINGIQMVTLTGACTNGEGLGNWCAPQFFICPAGTYYGMIGYYMFNGATTTFTDNGYTVTVYQLSG
jgi:hypothetical protein